jgi:Zn-dependent M28 family amino/carboxypeptidase
MRSAAVLCALALGCGGPAAQPQPRKPVNVPDLDPGGCGPFDAESLVGCVDPARVEADVRHIAVPRPPGSPQHLAVQELCAARLGELGYEVALEPYETGVNVVGTKAGYTRTDEVVVAGAHYDGTAGCPAADDNASGVAVLLEAARVLAAARLDRTLVVGCWDEGERRQLGSAAWAHEAKARGRRIALALSLEAVGYASDRPDTQKIPDRFEELFPDQALALLDDDHRATFLTIVADSPTRPVADAVARHARAAGLPTHVLVLTARQKIKQQDLHRSDHSSFWESGFPAMLITDSGPFRNPRIHCKEGPDDSASLDYRFAGRTARATVGGLADAAIVR